MNPAPFTDEQLLSKFEEYLVYLNSEFYPINKEHTILEFNQICEEINQRKIMPKKGKS